MTAPAVGMPALAARARELADAAPVGSLSRKSWACVAVALRTTRSLRAARQALAEVGPEDVRAAALERLDELTKELAT